jgi:hypothetical protein
MPSSGISRLTCSECTLKFCLCYDLCPHSNTTSLAAVDEAFNDGTRNDGTRNDPSTPNSTLNHDRDQSQAPEGRDDGLKWIKLELIRQVGMLERRHSFYSFDLNYK